MARDYEAIVKGLLNKANSVDPVTGEMVCSPQEQEALKEKAFAIMEREQIKLVQEDESKKASHYPVYFSGAWVSRQASLFNEIAKHYNCTVIDATNSRRMEQAHYIFGFDTDIDSVLFLFTILENHMLAELARVDVPRNTSTKSYRNSWLWGYIIRIKERLAETRKKEGTDHVPGYAVVLRDRSLAVQDEVKKVFPRTKTITNVYRGREAYAQGQAAGSRAQFHMGSNVNSSGRKELGR